MPTDDASHAPARRPTVRIVEPRVNWRAVVPALAVTGAAALLFVVSWRLWTREDHPAAFRRQLGDVELDWRCANGHTFKSPGSVEAVSCPTCKASANPVAVYVCEVHGPFEVAARFGLDAEGRALVTQRRVPGKEWVDAINPPVCPKCGKVMTRPKVDPLAGLKKTKTGGA